MQIFSFSPFGYEGSLVSVEVDLRRGIPAIDMVGLADGAVKESRERMRSAIRNCGFEFPSERVLISLSPADLKKEGAGFDLAVALAVLVAQSESDGKAEGMFRESVLIMGELELSGSLRPVRGIHAAVSTAKANGINMCIVPESNVNEAMQVKGIKVYGAKNLTDAFSALYSKSKFSSSENDCAAENTGIPEGSVEIEGVLFPPVERSLDFIDIEGQKSLTRALQIAAAGRHNLLVFGPPGCGKTLSLQKYPSLIPLLTPEEAHSVTRIYSIAGLLPASAGIVRTAKFRQPHQTASIEGMCGGGARCMPGEISLAHNGVLFLDEAAEFRSSVLQMLRVPLESGTITLSRAGRNTTFPARFQLLLATNPCPCGFYGSTDKICLCSSHSVDLYWKKFSGPLLDRMDIRIKADENAFERKEMHNAKSSAELRVQIAKAVSIQRKRQGKYNVYLTPAEIENLCVCTEDARKILSNAVKRFSFSPRAEASCIKLARTIADMSGKEMIDADDMQEAVNLRTPSGDLDLCFGL